jgi:hypothetical protein
MKIIRYFLCAVAVGTTLGLAMPVFAADDGDLIKQAEALVKQAWNAGGDPPSADERVQLLTKAYDLAKEEPDHRLRGTRAEAMRMIQVAIDAIKGGEEESKIYADLDEADRKLRDAISIAEGH